jgi:hypothetical protein
MKAYFMKLLFIFSIVLLTACVYSNTSESVDGTTSIEIDLSIEIDGKIQDVFKESEYVKIWFFNRSDVARSFLLESNDEDSKEVENNKYLNDNYVAQDAELIIANTNIEIDGDSKIVLNNIPVDSNYMIVGIPGKETGKSIQNQIIPLNCGEILPKDNIELYGGQYSKIDTVWNTNLLEGELVKFGNIVLQKKQNKKLKIQAIPAMLGTDSINELYLTGAFNAWDIAQNNYKMIQNEIGVYTIDLEKTASKSFEYKFLVNGRLVNDCTADILDGYSSKLTVNYENKSKYSPLITVVNPKKMIGLSKSAINLYPERDENYDADWENKGTIKIGVNTENYMLSDIRMTYLADLRNELNPANTYLINYEYEIWVAENKNIKEVFITYEGELDEAGNLLEKDDNLFGNTYIKNETIDKFVVKKRAINGLSSEDSYIIEEMFYVLENIEFPKEAGKYMFSVTAIDKENGYYKEEVVIELLD